MLLPTFLLETSCNENHVSKNNTQNNTFTLASLRARRKPHWNSGTYVIDIQIVFLVLILILFDCICIRCKDWRCVELREIDFLLKICDWFLACFSCGVKLLEYRYVQVWNIAKRWMHIPVGWCLESLQIT